MLIYKQEAKNYLYPCLSINIHIVDMLTNGDCSMTKNFLSSIIKIRKKLRNFLESNPNFRQVLLDVLVDTNSETLDIYCIIKRDTDVSLLSSFFSDDRLNVKFIHAEDLLKSSTFKNLISGGYSILKSKFLSDIIGYSNSIIFNYTISGLSQTDKTKFVYALYGRNKRPGVLADVKGKKIENSVVVIPRNGKSKIKEIFDKFGVKYSEIDALLKR